MKIAETSSRSTRGGVPEHAGTTRKPARPLSTGAAVGRILSLLPCEGQGYYYGYSFYAWRGPPARLEPTRGSHEGRGRETTRGLRRFGRSVKRWADRNRRKTE